MARQARTRSKTGIYHVMQRGNERKAVFLDEEDKNKYIETVLHKREAAGIEIYAYCVLDNHVHLVIREAENGRTIETYMKQVGVTYASFFNRKYKRVGHVFQDRFRSEPVEDEAYVHSVIRYVHRNPLKAGIIQGMDYTWSSYSGYIGQKIGVQLLPEMKGILNQFGKDEAKAIKRFKEFHLEEEPRAFLDIPPKSGEDGEGILLTLLRKYHTSKDTLAQDEDKGKLRDLITELIHETGVSRRQVAEMTGINRERVRRLFVSKEPSP